MSLFLLQHVKAQSNTDRVMDELTETIHKTADYDNKKIAGILQIQNQLKETDPRSIERSFELTKSIYEEYKVFNYDPAYRYTTKLLNLSSHVGDEDHIASAKMNNAFTNEPLVTLDTQISLGHYSYMVLKSL